jgi:valyl-tRNA synthetase
MWGDFADWYLEISKLQMSAGGDRSYYTAYTLVRVLDDCLRLLHPFTPFVTEELWGHLKAAAQAHSPRLAPDGGWEDALIIARWPEAQPEEGWESGKIAAFTLVQDVVRSIRNMRTEKKVTPGKKVPAIIAAGDRLDILAGQRGTIAALAHLDPDGLELVTRLAEKPQGAASAVVAGVEIYLPLEDLVDPEVERARLQKDLSDTEAQIERLEKLLSSSFAEKAPAAVVDKERQKLATFKETAARLREQLG